MEKEGEEAIKEMNTADENLSADRFILLVLADFFELVALALRVTFPVLKMLRSVTEPVKALGSIFPPHFPFHFNFVALKILGGDFPRKECREEKEKRL